MNNIVSFQAFHMAKNFPAISGVIEYWTKLAQLGDIPRRSDIDPRLLGESLPYIFLLDRVGDDRASFRICGTYITTLFGEDAKGRPLDDLFSYQARPHLNIALQRLWTTSFPLVFNIVADGIGTDQNLSGKLAILPLRDAFGGKTKAIGVIQASGRIKYPPYNSDIEKESQLSNSEIASDAYRRLSSLPKGRLSLWS